MPLGEGRTDAAEHSDCWGEDARARYAKSRHRVASDFGTAHLLGLTTATADAFWAR